MSGTGKLFQPTRSSSTFRFASRAWLQCVKHNPNHASAWPFPQAARFRAAFASAAKFVILAKSRLSRASHSALATAYGKPFDEPLSTNRQCKEKTSLFWRGSICGSGLFLRLLMLRMSVTPLAAVTCKPRSLATSSAQPAASFTTDQHNSLSNTITSKRSLATSMPQKERCAIFVSLPC